MENKKLRVLAIAIAIGWMMVYQYEAYAQTEAATVQGNWVNEPGTRKAEFYSQGNAWFGKLTWVEDDSKLKTGDVLFSDLVWNGKQFNGTANTARGKIPCVITFESSDKIKITASKGPMSKSVYWTRVK